MRILARTARCLLIGARVVLSAGATAALLTGCSGSQTSTGAPGAMPQTSAAASRANPGGSWMLPSAKAKDLVYVSDYGSGSVDVYALPSLKSNGTLTGFNGPEGLCSDASGNVWIANTNVSQIVEYAHGGTTPIATLNDPGYYPAGCSIDPTTGDLAVTNLSSNSSYGNVIVYTKGSGSGSTYFDHSIATYYFDGYDNRGNLYLDGLSESGTFKFAELHRRNHKFTNITINESISFPGSVQWDGKHMTTTPQPPSGSSILIYRLKISGSKATVINTTQLLPTTCEAVQTWIAGAIIAASCDLGKSSSVNVWTYPQGGAPSRSAAGPTTPLGTTISLAPLSLARYGNRRMPGLR